MVADVTRCGFVAVIGLPNAGKSTLVNSLVGQKISIVSRKVQTTRSRVLGVALSGMSQIILLDTPGFLKAPQKRLEKSMVRAALEAPKEADLTLLIVDVSRQSPEGQKTLLEQVRKQKIWVVLNKIDQIDKPKLLIWADFFRSFPKVERTFMISALTGSGIPDLLKALSQVMPMGPWLFPHDQVATTPQRLLAAEITREVLFQHVHQEVPYNLYVETEAWETFRNGSVKISQIIHVMKETQKAIVLGHEGKKIKTLSTLARQQIADVLGVPVHLFLHVNVTPDWMERTSFYALMGLCS